MCSRLSCPEESSHGPEHPLASTYRAPSPRNHCSVCIVLSCPEHRVAGITVLSFQAGFCHSGTCVRGSSMAFRSSLVSAGSVPLSGRSAVCSPLHRRKDALVWAVVGLVRAGFCVDTSFRFGGINAQKRDSRITGSVHGQLCENRPKATVSMCVRGSSQRRSGRSGPCHSRCQSLRSQSL